MNNFFYTTCDIFFDETKTLKSHGCEIVRADLHYDSPGLPRTEWAMVKREFLMLKGHLLVADIFIAKHRQGESCDAKPVRQRL